VFAHLRAVKGNLDNADVLISPEESALRSRWVALSPRSRTVEQKAACELKPRFRMEQVADWPHGS
jgi:hypothetical protein